MPDAQGRSGAADSPPACGLERIVEFDGISNFRDLGGIPAPNGARVRRGVIFRSGKLSEASDDDVRRLSVLRIRTVVDLREQEVQQEYPDRLPCGRPVRVLSLPMSNGEIARFSEQWAILMDLRRPDVDSGTLAGDVYASFVRDFAWQAREFLAVAALEENLPLLVHCSAGKDRTGILVALLLAQLGVAYEYVVQDYLLTNWCKRDVFNRLMSGHPFPKLVRSFAEVREEYLRAAFDAAELVPDPLDAHVREQLGISDGLARRLRQTLLDATPDAKRGETAGAPQTFADPRC
jgi:protein-tyrosine phosphatase